MARVPEITTRDGVPSDKKHIFDEIAGSRGTVSGPFAVLLNSPEIAGRSAHLGTYIRFESTLSSAERELAIITTSRAFDCQYEWSAHATLAREAGIREEAIEVVANRGALDSLTEDEALVVGYTREVLRDHKVTDETFTAARARFGDQGVTELTATVGYYSMLACALNAFEVTAAPDTPRLPALD